MAQMKLKQMGRLQALDLRTSDSQREPDTLVFVCCHGYGADAFDLAPLAAEARRFGVGWVFPQGPLEVPIGPMMSGRAWFPIDVGRFERAAMSGSYRELTRDEPQGLDRACDQLLSLIESLGVPSERVVVGGFSQGAMLASHLVFARGFAARGLVALSGSIMAQEKWEFGLRQPGMPREVFQSHGASDGILPVDVARDLRDLMVTHGIDVDYIEFRGGHEIPMEVLHGLGGYLERMVNSKC